MGRCVRGGVEELPESPVIVVRKRSLESNHGLKSCAKLRLCLGHVSGYVLACCCESSAEINHLLTSNSGSKNAPNEG